MDINSVTNEAVWHGNATAKETYAQAAEEYNKIANALECTGVPTNPLSRQAPYDIAMAVDYLRILADELESSLEWIRQQPRE